MHQLWGDRSRLDSHNEFAFQFIVGLCVRPGKAHSEKGALRGYQRKARIHPPVTEAFPQVASVLLLPRRALLTVGAD